jgi:hypothetical protein
VPSARVTGFTLALAALVLVSPGRAAPPVLVTAAQVDGHPTATWTLPPGVRARVVEVATSPDTGTDGPFFEENVRIFDVLQDAQTAWTSSKRLEPGAYYLHVGGFDAACFTRGECQLREFTSPVTVTIPNVPPTIRLLGLAVSGVRFRAAAARVVVCDLERGEVTVAVRERRSRRGRVLAAASHTHAVRLTDRCERRTLRWEIQPRLVRPGQTYTVELVAEDRHGGTSPAVVSRRVWRSA